jgi:hypothetical protein
MARYKAWQFATLARQLLPVDAVGTGLAGGSPDLADLSYGDELVLFA